MDEANLRCNITQPYTKTPPTVFEVEDKRVNNQRVRQVVFTQDLVIKT